MNPKLIVQPQFFVLCRKKRAQQEVADAENAAPTSSMQAAPYPMQIPQSPAPNAELQTGRRLPDTGPSAAYLFTGK